MIIVMINIKETITEYKIRIAKWCLVKLLELCKGDYGILNSWLYDLKWEKVKETFAMFKKASDNEKLNYERLARYRYVKPRYKVEKIADNSFFLIETHDNKKVTLAQFTDEVILKDFINYKLDQEVK